MTRTKSNPSRGPLVAEGKTKRLYEAVGGEWDSTVIVEHKNTITRHNDPNQTREFESKGRCSTAFATHVFELLTKAGIPNAFIRRIGENEFVMEHCRMIPLEVVVRRLAMGSYFDRNPNMEPGHGSPAPRFHRLVFELFVKTTDGYVTLWDGSTHDAGIRDPHRQDPYVMNPTSDRWHLAHPHLPLWDPKSLMVDAQPEEILGDATVHDIEEIARRTFLVLESALANVGSRLADFKIELGINQYGEMVVADVIDPDSLRQAVWGPTWGWRAGWIDFSKQSFRDGEDMETVEFKYQNAAMLAERIRIPRQVIVTWTGSPNDVIPEVPADWRVDLQEVVISGHKKPGAVIGQLEKILADYPDGGVIIAKVGMSNGLGPILAARTNWPIISVVADSDAHPEDVWSSLRMPSNVPNLTVLSEKNAVLAAGNILAQKNPIVYAHRQYEIEDVTS